MIPLKKLLSITLFALLSTAAFAEGAINPIPVIGNDWRFSGTISGWAPASWTTASASRLSKTADSSISDNLNSASAFAFLTAEAHKGDWGLMADLVYSQMGGSGSTTKYIPNKDDLPNSLYAGQNTKIKETVLTFAGTYTAYRSDNVYLDALAGVRYISLTTSLDANAKLTVDGSTYPISPSLNKSFTNQTTDAIIGFKGRARIADSSWFIPYYADIGKGPGSNTTTWQTLVGVGNAYSWGDVTLSYRAMYFGLDSRVAAIKSLTAGPQISATFNF